MDEITEKNIEIISKFIDEQGLTYTHLKNELLDHICCETEYYMQQGMKFNDAYSKVRANIGKKRIRLIQNETLSLISKKYRRMKRLMYILGVLAPILVIASSLLKMYHLQGGQVMFSISMVTIGLIFLPVYVLNRIRDTRKMDEKIPWLVYITGLFSGMISISGAILKVLHLAGAKITLAIGLISFAVVFLPVFAIFRLKESENEKNTIDKKSLILGLIAGIFFITGALFKIMHWRGAATVMIASWSVVAVLFLPILILNQLKQTEKQINNFFNILVLVTGISIFIMALIRGEPKTNLSGFIIPEAHFYAQPLETGRQ